MVDEWLKLGIMLAHCCINVEPTSGLQRSYNVGPAAKMTWAQRWSFYVGPTLGNGWLCVGNMLVIGRMCVGDVLVIGWINV